MSLLFANLAVEALERVAELLTSSENDGGVELMALCLPCWGVSAHVGSDSPLSLSGRRHVPRGLAGATGVSRTEGAMLSSSTGPRSDRLTRGRLRTGALTAIELIRRIARLFAVVALVALIAVPAAQASTTTISAAAGVQFSGVVDSSPSCTPTSVMIDWGDGSTPSTGTYDAVNNVVTGTHTYTTQGTFSGTVILTGASCTNDTLIASVAAAPQFQQCPPVDKDFGCQFLIVVSASGTTVLQDTTQGPYEGSEDALIGIQNNSSNPISAIPLAAPGSSLFGFDGDGICRPGSPPVPSGCGPPPGGTTCTGSSVCSFPAPPGQPPGYTEPGAQSGSTQNGYEGPTTWYSNVSADLSGGQVNFSPSLQPGQSTFFSQESPPSLAALAVGSTPQVVTFSTPPTVTSRGASFSGVVNPNGAATTAFFQYGLDARYSTRGASGPVYNQSTPGQSVAVSSSHPVIASISALMPNAQYHVRLVASNKSGTTLGPDQTFMTMQDPAPPPPTLGKTLNVKPVSGLVLIKPPAGKALAAGDMLPNAVISTGQGFIPLTQVRQIPAGSQIDARQGSLQLTAAASHGGMQNGAFSGGLFSIAQDRRGPSKGLTTLSLLEGNFRGAPTYASCRAHPAFAAANPSAQAALSRRVLQTLTSSVDAHFRTRGRYSADLVPATVHRAVLTTSDRCNGTLTVVRRGTVLVTDFRRRVTVTVRAGHSYLADAIPRKHK